MDRFSDRDKLPLKFGQRILPSVFPRVFDESIKFRDIPLHRPEIRRVVRHQSQPPVRQQHTPRIAKKRRLHEPA